MALAACGGGGGSSGSPGTPPGGSSNGDRVSLTASGATTPVPSLLNTDLEFVVANPGTSAATDVTLTITLGSGLSRAGMRCTASGGAMCPANPDATTVPTLPSGGSLRFAMSVIPIAGTTGAITSSASVTAANDAVTSNNSAQVSITAYSADVQVTGSVSASELHSGSIATYSYTVSNAGPDAARNVTLNQTASSAQSITTISCTAAGGATCPATTGAQMVVPSLPAAGSLNFTVTTLLSMDATVSVSSTLAVTSFGDGNASNDAATISARTRIPTSSGTPSFAKFQADDGDYIGGEYGTLAARAYSYTLANAEFDVQPQQGLLILRVKGDERWDMQFAMPAHLQQLKAGEYIKTLAASIYDPAAGGFAVAGRNNGCEHSGWFTIDDVVYGSSNNILSLDLRFEQHCYGKEPALRGQIHWIANDTTRPPGPVNPAPTGLWDAAPGATPASGNYVYIVSDAGDFVGQGRTETYTPTNSILRASATGSQLGVGVDGNRNYLALFEAMVPLTRVEPGYYPNVQSTGGGNATVGGLGFGGDGRGCNVITGWFVIDSVSYSGSTLTAVDARFEQHCEGATPALRGKIHWRSDDTTQPPGPQVPPPAGLWAPPAGAVPATGNVVYLQSEVDDWIGQGLTKAYTPLDSVITVGTGGMTPVGNRFQITVKGNEEWQGYFQAMSTLTDVRPGYYGDLLGFPSHNPAKGGVSWSGEFRGCNKARGWFAVDNISYSGSSVDSIELRFEQYCDTSPKPLHGYIRWSAADMRTPPPPQNPPPANLWAPPDGATPATGNYFYFESDPGDYIGIGQKRLFTPPTSTITLNVSGSQLGVDVMADAKWSGYFVPMVPLTQLQVGYYGDITQRSIAKGLLFWAGDGRACSPAGWFVVDNVKYVAGAITEIDLRFEQHCGVETPALHGKLHWRSDNPQLASKVLPIGFGARR